MAYGESFVVVNCATNARAQCASVSQSTQFYGFLAFSVAATASVAVTLQIKMLAPVISSSLAHTVFGCRHCRKFNK